MVRLSTSFLVGMVLLAGACGGSNNASGSHSDASTCSVGALGCACTAGGGCDPDAHCDPALHICVSNIGSGGSGGAVPDAGAGSGGTSGSGAAGSAGASGSGGSSGGAPATGGASGSGGAAGNGGTGGLPDGIGIIPCGSVTCTAPQACCYKYQQVAGSSTYQTSWTCIDPSTTSCASCTGTDCRVTLIQCHSRADCSSGELCCPVLNGAKSSYASVSCCTKSWGAGTVCDPNDAQPCPPELTKLTCKDGPSSLPGYHTCQY